jgi:spore germination cell wall hydrolase CwlJ-like protein
MSTDRSLMYTAARRAFAQATGTLAHRRAGHAPDWLDRAAVRAVWLPLPGSQAPTTLHVGLREGWSPGAFPRHWRLPDDQVLPVTCVPAEAPQAQALPTLSPDRRPTFAGSATGLVQDCGTGARYLLTCGHVAAPGPQSRAGDRVTLSGVPGVSGRPATLRLWQPMLAEGAYKTKIDAALLALDETLYGALRAQGDLLPTGLCRTVHADQPLSLRRRSGPVDGHALVYWSGEVDIPGLSPGEADYFLEQAIGYRCTIATQGGDSGSAVWDQDERLCGMHLAGLVNAGASMSEPNAIFGSIGPVLDWFGVEPILRGGRTAQAASPASSTRNATPAASAAALSDQEVVAATIWGEARNQGEAGLRAVACVIANRARTRYRRCAGAREVCLDRWQFSCWNDNDPNRAKLLAAARAPDTVFTQALALAADVLAHRLPDITHNARHYHTSRVTPAWARGKKPCAVVGDHLFYNDVA